MFGGVFSGRRVLVTGHTGFKGSWLSSWLLDLGAVVGGYADGVPTDPSHFEVLGLRDRVKGVEGDVRDFGSLQKAFRVFEPEVVFHVAAQSLVRRSYGEPVATFATNAFGTVNVLECIRTTESVRAGVIVTSDKCYRNVEWTWGYRENDQLGGGDPYSASKACAELAAAAYGASYFSGDGPAIATARAGNVIGGGDWAADRIVPDCVRAWSAGDTVQIRSPQATRPWQHVLEPLSGYLALGARLLDGGPELRNEAFNFGPPSAVTESVGDLIDAMTGHWDAARWEIDGAGTHSMHEATLLRLNCDKAMNLLGWRAILGFQECVRFTSDWYRAFYQDGPEAATRLTQTQIREYCRIAKAEGLPWA
jgi:CDP-glucose 4,6-dehydratase